MPISWKTLRAVLVLVIAVIVSIRDYGATLYASYDLCSDVCSSSSCATECYENEMEFENGNSISCLDYGVYDTGQACCGDGNCNNGEDTGSCYADCYDPNPPGPQVAVLVNGSLNPLPPDWISYGSAMFNAVWGTYGVQPVTFFWSQNSAGEVTGAYEGITDGAIDLADAINTLPAGNVNIVAHSHGGNVSIIATGYINRQIQHLVELRYARELELPRYVSGTAFS